jgi:hypothetical protein
MKEEEIWKDIPEYEGLYQISNLGRIKSLHGKGRIMSLILNGKGYYCVHLCKNGNQTTHYIHTIIAISFLNHKSCGYKFVINHIDGNHINNNLHNLEIVTHRENTSTCFRKNKDTFSSKYIGVSWDKSRSKWMTRIQINGKTKHLGYFSLEIDASEAYQKELSKLIYH